MKAVFLTYYYPPLKGPRSFQISRLIKYSRHEIWLVSADGPEPKDNSVAGDWPGNPTMRTSIKHRQPAKIDPRWLLNLLPVPDRFRGWALDAAKAVLQSGQLKQDDVLVTFGQPMSDHLAGLNIKRATGIRWIAHFSDPWIDSPYRVSLPGISWLNRRMEEAVIAAADCLVFTSAETIELVMRKYPSFWAEKAVVLPHSYDPDLYGKVVRADRGELLVRYLGNFYRPRTPEPLVRALRKLQHEQPRLLDKVRFEMIGRVIGSLAVADWQRHLPDGLFNVLPSVDYLASLKLMQDSDLLLIIDAPFERSVFLPSKLIDYMGAARPVFAISPPGVTAKIVRQLGGQVVSPIDIDAIANRLGYVLEGLRTGETCRIWDASLAQSQYAAPQVAARFDELIAMVASKR